MAVFDTLQRVLDAQTNRIANVGTPTTANDATITDNTTAPSNPTATASAGASFLAAPANHVHQAVHSIHADASANIFGDIQLISGSGVTLTQSGQGITVAVAGGATTKVLLNRYAQSYNNASGEAIVDEYNVSFDDVSSGNIQVRMSGIVKTAGGTATYNCRVGATGIGATTGSTTRATFTTTSASEAQATNQGSAFTNPTGQQLLQVTVSNTGANNSFIRGFAISIG